MNAQTTRQRPASMAERNPFTLPLEIEVKPHGRADHLLAKLGPDTPWGDRQIAARKLGYMRSLEAVAILLDFLPADPFWMVRCSMIQALERIGDPKAIPALQQVAEGDRFQVVRSHAIKAIGKLAEKERASE
jgi:HEAT repeat protein